MARNIYQVLMRNDNFNRKPRCRRQSMTTVPTDRRIQILVSIQNMSIRHIKSNLSVQVYKEIVYRRIKECDYTKQKKKVTNRVSNYTTNKQEWSGLKSTCLTETSSLRFYLMMRKKCCLDGNDRWKTYWHDLRKESMIFFSRQKGYKSVMVWRTFGFNSHTSLASVRGRQNSLKYREMMNQHLLLFGDILGGL